MINTHFRFRLSTLKHGFQRSLILLVLVGKISVQVDIVEIGAADNTCASSLLERNI